MTCCPHCESADRFFNRKVAESDLRDYQRHGPGGTTKQLLDALKTPGVSGMSLLDIGGGIGVIQHELRAAGVTEITGVDASSAYLQLARREAERRGYAGEARYLHGDFVALADEIDAADIVTMDRVICCYPDVEALVDAAAARAKRFLGLVYPRDNGLLKLGAPFLNGYFRLRREAFRIFVHPTRQVERIMELYALRKVAHHQELVWQMVVYGR